MWRYAGVLCLLAVAGASPLSAAPFTEVTFGTNWIAQAEHGGYYQALADGTYEKYGLKVTIVPGGPRAANRMLMTVGKLDFYMGGSMIQAFSAAEKDIPTVVVAAHFQKDPQILMSHPGQGFDTFEDLKRSNDLLLSKDGVATFFQWMKAEYGFRDEQVRPFGFNPAPFIADKKAVQQGYVTAEPLTIEKAAGFKPNVFLLADYGFSTYATTVETRREVVEKSPDLVQRFVDASSIGWHNYLHGDNAGANALIKRDNPEMTDELLAYSVTKLKQHGIVEFGRRIDAWDRSDDRRPHERLFRQDGEVRSVQGGSRLSQGLHASVREQGRRARTQQMMLRDFMQSRRS